MVPVGMGIGMTTGDTRHTVLAAAAAAAAVAAGYRRYNLAYTVRCCPL